MARCGHRGRSRFTPGCASVALRAPRAPAPHGDSVPWPPPRPSARRASGLSRRRTWPLHVGFQIATDHAQLVDDTVDTGDRCNAHRGGARVEGGVALSQPRRRSVVCVTGLAARTVVAPRRCVHARGDRGSCSGSRQPWVRCRAPQLALLGVDLQRTAGRPSLPRIAVRSGFRGVPEANSAQPQATPLRPRCTRGEPLAAGTPGTPRATRRRGGIRDVLRLAPEAGDRG